MKIYIGADHNGFEMKRRLAEYLWSAGFEVSDVGEPQPDPQDDYPVVAARVIAAMRAGGDAEPRGILLCGSGQGICIAANRFKGIRAAVCDTPEAARAGRNDDDTNVLCLPAKALDGGQVEAVVKAWLDTAFAGAARYKRRIAELDTLE